MKRNTSYKLRRGILAAAVAAALYLVLLAVLTAAERSSPDSSINSFWDALWYSIVTLTTVGYGDLYPVTAAGRILGVLFVLLSLGLLSFIMGLIVQVLTGQMLPAMQLRLLRRRPWYVFSQFNEASAALAADLAAGDNAALCLFPLSQRDEAGDMPYIRFYPGSMAKAVAGKKDNCRLFFMDDASGANYAPALAALELGFPVYCRTEQSPDRCPENLTLFNRYDICAQDYWCSLPIEKQEKTVLLVGSGKYARRLLEQGLLVNVFGKDRRVCYHVFGDWELFRLNHPQLGLTVSIDEYKEVTDCLFFHNGPWNSDAQLLCSADRIILCDDDEGENLAVLRRLRRYFPVKGRLHIRAAAPIPGETVFGTIQNCYTADLVLRSGRTAAARTMHRIYSSDPNWVAPKWEELSDFTRLSNICAADHLLTKIRLLLDDDNITGITDDNCTAAYLRYSQTRDQYADEYRSIEHLRWMRFHSMYNWSYAPVRNNAARQHHLMLPYEELPPEEQRKDDFAWELLGMIPEAGASD